jgi:hypothetical protein
LPEVSVTKPINRDPDFRIASVIAALRSDAIAYRLIEAQSADILNPFDVAGLEYLLASACAPSLSTPL